MAALTVQSITSLSSITPSFAAASSGGDTFENNGRTLLYIKNANVGASRTVTINSLVNCNQGHDHDVEVTVAASSEEMTSFFPMARFNNTTGSASVTYSTEADLTIAAIKVE